MRDFLSHSLTRRPNRRRWERQRKDGFYQRMGRLGGEVRARLIHTSVRLRCGGEVWRPWAAN